MECWRWWPGIIVSEGERMIIMIWRNDGTRMPHIMKNNGQKWSIIMWRSAQPHIQTHIRADRLERNAIYKIITIIMRDISHKSKYLMGSLTDFFLILWLCCSGCCVIESKIVNEMNDSPFLRIKVAGVNIDDWQKLNSNRWNDQNRYFAQCERWIGWLPMDDRHHLQHLIQCTQRIIVGRSIGRYSARFQFNSIHCCLRLM